MISYYLHMCVLYNGIVTVGCLELIIRIQRYVFATNEGASGPYLQITMVF